MIEVRVASFFDMSTKGAGLSRNFLVTLEDATSPVTASIGGLLLAKICLSSLLSQSCRSISLKEPVRSLRRVQYQGSLAEMYRISVRMVFLSLSF